MLEKAHFHCGKQDELQVISCECIKRFNDVSNESNIAYKQSAFCRVHNYEKAQGQVTSRMVGRVGQIGIKEG
mgnify:CR=1 FL=1